MTTTVEVDIGYIPEMELSLARPVPPVQPPKWSEEIAMKKAFTLVERHLYPFKKVSQQTGVCQYCLLHYHVIFVSSSRSSASFSFSAQKTSITCYYVKDIDE